MAEFPAGSTSAEFVDIFNKEQIAEVVSRHDLVISYIPPAFHMEIVRACLAHSKNMVTSSYITPALMETDAEWKRKDITCLMECGLDPGIDIMSTFKVLEDCKNEGIKVVGYESYCGGLPAGEATDNPLGYKYSWNPGAALSVSK